MNICYNKISYNCGDCARQSGAADLGVFGMNIGLIAHNSKKSLIEDFCLAYKHFFSKHELYATGITGRRVEEVTNMKVHKFLPGAVGGDKQFIDMIERNCLDMVIFFYNPAAANTGEPDIYEISRYCDEYRIPISRQRSPLCLVWLMETWTGD